MNDAVFAKLLRSTQSALPVEADCWGALAHGLRLSGDELAAMLRPLVESGVLLGVVGEINVALREVVEVITFDDMPPALRAIRRWRAQTPNGVIASWAVLGQERAAADSAWHSREILKASRIMNQSCGSATELLGPATDRTTRIMPGEELSLELAGERSARVLAALLEPFKPLTSNLQTLTSPWDWLGARCGCSPEEARAEVRKLLTTRVLRRFAFRFSPLALRWKGCALASWRYDSNDVAAHAAAELAAFAGTGDVVVREPHPDTGANLTALFIGRDPGAGIEAPREISRRWKREAVSCEELGLDA